MSVIKAALDQLSGTMWALGLDNKDVEPVLKAMARGGVFGADAGTILKSIVWGLESFTFMQGKSYKRLGLDLWDDAGDFKGFVPFFNQLHKASQRCDPDGFRVDTFILLGTSCLSFAEIAAKFGPVEVAE